MAAHVLLEEGGEKYEPIRLDLAKSSGQKPISSSIRSAGFPCCGSTTAPRSPRTRRYCPIKRFGLWPSDALGEAKLLSLIGYFAAAVHPAYAHVGRPERYSDDPSDFPALRDKGLKTFHGYLKDIDARLAGREWFSDRYSAADPYGLVFYAWGARRELPVGELKNYTAFNDRMLQRPAVRRALDDEQIKV
jgi:glutathione S-transferase